MSKIPDHPQNLGPQHQENARRNHHQPQKNFKDLMETKDSYEDEKKKKNSSGIFSLLAEKQQNVHSIESGQSFAVHESKLSSDFQILFDRLAEALSHEQKQGISETIVHIRSANSRFIFNGSQFRIVHYDTAPHRFNIQFCGTESSINYFQKHMGELAIALQKQMPDCHVHFANPVLNTEDYDFSRKKMMQQRPSKSRQKSMLKPFKALDKIHD